MNKHAIYNDNHHIFRTQSISHDIVHISSTRIKKCIKINKQKLRGAQ